MTQNSLVGVTSVLEETAASLFKADEDGSHEVPPKPRSQSFHHHRNIKFHVYILVLYPCLQIACLPHAPPAQKETKVKVHLVTCFFQLQ